MAKSDDVTPTFTRAEALALEKAADIGLRVIETLHLVQTTATMERALNKLRAAAA